MSEKQYFTWKIKLLIKSLGKWMLIDSREFLFLFMISMHSFHCQADFFP